MEKEIKVTPLYFDYVFGAEYDAVIEVGGRYSGKSYNSQIEEAANLASKKDYKLLIIQELDKGSSDGYYAGIIDKIEQFEHTPAYNITGSSTKVTNNINGNSVLFRGYKTTQQKKDVKNIDQVTKIVVEEGEWMTFDDFLSLVQQLRGKVKEDRRLDILLNPVNTECFVNKELIMKPPTNILEYFPNSKRPKVFERLIDVDTVDLEGKPTKLSIKILIVLSTHYDNPHLTGMQRAAIEIYRTTDPDKYKQLGEAKFIQSSGAFFKEFDEDIHIIEPFEPPNHWPVYTTMDYGLDMQATYAVAFDTDDTMYVFRRVYKPNQIISQAAQNNLKMLGNLKSIYNYGPPDLMKRQQSNGRTTWEMFSEYGWRLDETSNRREEGSLAMKERFKVYQRTLDDGTTKLDSKIKITSDCTDLIRTIKQVLTHKKNANVYAAHSSEIEGTSPSNYHELTHAPDAIRYICIMHRVCNILEEAEENSNEEYFEEVMTW